MEAHANVKIFMKKRSPKQLVKMVAGFESIGLNILHLTVTTIDHSVLYSFTVKVRCLLLPPDFNKTKHNFQLYGNIS